MAETLQQYLVELGFKVDKGQEARFNATLGSIEKTFARLAAGLVAAATSISATVIAVSSSLDKLYWSSQRTGASVASMRSLSYALSQVGGDAAQAMGAFEGLASALRTSPGLEGMLNKNGILTRQNGQLKETGALLDEIVEKYGKRPYYQSAQIAGMLGIGDERAWNTFVTQWAKVREFQKQQREASGAMGVDPDKAAAASKDLMQSVRQLLETVSLLTDKIAIELQPKLLKILQDLQEWFVRHQDDIVKAVEGIIDAVKGLIEDFGKLVTAMSPVVDKFTSLTSAITGDDNSLKIALEGVLAYMTGKWLLGIVGVFSKIGGAWAMVAALLAYDHYFGSLTPGSAMGKAAGMGATSLAPGETTATPGAGDPFNKYMEGGGAVGQAWRWVKGKLRLGSSVGRNDQTRALMRGDGGSLALAKITTKSGQSAMVAKEYAPQFQGFIDDLEKQGYAINDLQGFSDRLIAGSSRRSQHSFGKAIDINPGPNDLGTGTGDLPANTAELAKKWGLGWGALWRSKNDPMHFSTDPYEGGRLMSPEEIEKLKAIGDKSSYLMSPSPIGGNISRSASLNQKTDITIIGSSDPAGTSAALGGAQNRLAGEMIRNAQSAFA